jgi:hypothetical protein
MTSEIGTWVARWVARFAYGAHATRRVTRWHMIESEIEDRKVTRCGRELGDRDPNSSLLSPNSSLLSPERVGVSGQPPEADRCRYCQGGG